MAALGMCGGKDFGQLENRGTGAAIAYSDSSVDFMLGLLLIGVLSDG